MGEAPARLATLFLALSVGLAAAALVERLLENRRDIDGAIRGSGDVDFGAVDPGTACPFTILVHNGRDEAVAVDRVTASCGCTSVSFDRPLVLPGESLRISGYADTAAPGNRSSSIYVWLHDEDEPYRVGTVRVAIRSGWVASRSDVCVDMDAAVGSIDRQIRFTSDDLEVSRVTACRIDLPFLRLVPQQVGRLLVISVEAIDEVPLGSCHAAVEIFSTSRSTPHFESHVVVRHGSQRLRLEPRTLLTPLDCPDRTTETTFRVLVDDTIMHVEEVHGLDHDVARVASWHESPDGTTVTALEPADALDHVGRLRLLLANDAARAVVEVLVRPAAHR